SHITILPASAAATAISAWVSLGLAMSIRSMSLRSISLRQSLSEDSKPQLAAKSAAPLALRVQTAFSTGSWSSGKNSGAWWKALEWVRPMKPPPMIAMLSFFLAMILRASPLFAPTMRVAHLDHGREHVVPGLLPGHHRVGEHAAVPADMPHLLGQLAALVAQPVAGILRHVELAVGIGRLHMAAGLLMIAGAENGAVVLRDVEVIGPGPQGIGHLLVGGVELRAVLPVVIFRQQPVAFGIVAQGEEHGMRHVGLVADHARHADLFEQVHVLAPGLHPAPADLALGEQVFAVILGDLARLAEGLGDPLGVADRVVLPVGHAAGGIDPDAAARP